MFLVPNIDQIYKEMKKIKTGNQSVVEIGDEFPDFADLFFFFFFFGMKNVRVGGKILGSVGRSETHIYFFLA
jgi:hypothetical protein